MQMIEQMGTTPAPETQPGSAPAPDQQGATSAPAQQPDTPAPRFRDWAAI